MALYASQFETAGYHMEAWQRISSTQLRLKIIKTWTRRYVGIMSEADADALLSSEISLYTNVDEGGISMDESGMWVCTINFKTAEWADPAQYQDG